MGATCEQLLLLTDALHGWLLLSPPSTGRGTKHRAPMQPCNGTKDKDVAMLQDAGCCLEKRQLDVEKSPTAHAVETGLMEGYARCRVVAKNSKGIKARFKPAMVQWTCSAGL